MGCSALHGMERMVRQKCGMRFGRQNVKSHAMIIGRVVGEVFKNVIW